MAVKKGSKSVVNRKRTPTGKAAIQRKLTNARHKYVHGIEVGDGELVYPSVADLAKEYGVSVQTIRDHCAKEKWVDDREAAEIEYRRRRDAQLIRDKLKAIADFDNQSFNLAKVLQGEVARFIYDKRDEMAMRREHSTIPIDNETERQRRKRELEQFYNPFNGAVLTQLAAALTNAQRVGRLAVGESTENLNVDDNTSPLIERFNELVGRLALERANS